MSISTAQRDYLGNTLTQFPLEPCPFCGCQVKMQAVSIGSGWVYGVVCRSTEGHGGTCCMEQVPSRTVEAAAKRWNMRKPMEALAAKPEHAVYHQFTRGEWLVDSSDHTVCIEQEGEAFIVATVGAIDVLEIATDTLSAKFYYGPESVANAYLMRAAPKLLHALERLTSYVRLGGKVDVPNKVPAGVHGGLNQPIPIIHPLDEAQAAINSALMRLPRETHIPTDGDAADFEAV